jgi:hypothetical protein
MILRLILLHLLLFSLAGKLETSSRSRRFFADIIKASDNANGTIALFNLDVSAASRLGDVATQHACFSSRSSWILADAAYAKSLERISTSYGRVTSHIENWGRELGTGVTKAYCGGRM